MRIFIMLILILLPSKMVLATEIDQSLLDSQMNTVNFSEVDSVIKKSTSEEVDIKQLVLKAIKGELDISFNGMWEWIYRNFFNEVYTNISLMRNLIVISFLSAILKNLTSSFKGEAVSELGFYSTYVVLIMIVFSSFNEAIMIVRDLVSGIVGLMQAAVPLMVSLMYMSGNVTSAYALSPIVLFATNILSTIIVNYIIPVIVFAAVIKLINHLSERDILERFSTLIETVVKFLLKSLATAFMGVIALQGLTAPIISNTIGKTAKAAMNAVPVVGEVLISTVDIVTAYAKALKGGTMASLIVVIIIMCALPLLKLIILVLIYKLLASLIQPICDERIVRCLDTVGNFTFLLLAAGVSIAVMFVFSVIIMLSF